MKLLILFTFSISIVVFASCAEKTKPKAQSQSIELDEKFSTQKKIKELEDKGELLDSCQFPWVGNCLYRLCGSKDLGNIIDSSEIIPGSRILVTYVPKVPLLITNEEDKSAYFAQDNTFKIYSHVIFKEFPDTIKFDDFLSKDISNAVNNGEIVSKLESITTSDAIKGVVYQYRIKTDECFAICYIDVSKYIVMIVFSAKDFTIYSNFYWVFSDLVKSFKYYGD